MAENTWASLLGEDHARTCKWLGSPPFISQQKSHLEGEQQHYLGDLLTMIINPLLTGMILQVGWNKNHPQKEVEWNGYKPYLQLGFGAHVLQVHVFFWAMKFYQLTCWNTWNTGLVFQFRHWRPWNHFKIFDWPDLENQTCLEKLPIHQWKVY